MNGLKNWSVQIKLILGLAAVVGLLAGLALLEYAGLARVADSEGSLFGRNMENISDLARLRSNLDERLDVFVSTEFNPGTWETRLRELDTRQTPNPEILKRLEARLKEDPAALDKLAELTAVVEQFRKTRDSAVMPLLHAGRTDEAKALILGVQLQRHIRIRALTRDLEARELAQAQEMVGTAGGTVKTLIEVFAFVGGSAVLGAVVLSVFLKNSLASYISERNRAEAELGRAKRALRATSTCNQLLVRAESEVALLRDICEAIVREGAFRFVWIGVAEDDPEKTVRPVAQAGDDSGFLANLRISWGENDLGHGPTGVAIRTGLPAICRDTRNDPAYAPWREEALKRGFASALVLPLSAKGRVFGSLAIYAADVGAFDGDEVRLLSELAEDLAYGIQTHRTREEHQKAEKSLRLFRAVVERSIDGIEIIEPSTGRIVDVNETACRMLGYTREEFLGLTVFDLDSGVYQSAFGGNAAQRDAAEYLSVESLHRRKDGTVFPVEVSVSRVMLDREYGVAIVRDITQRRRMEEALRSERTLLNDLLNSHPDHIYFKDRQSRFVRINQVMVERFGLRNSDEAVGKTDLDMYGREHAEQAFADEQRIMETGKPMICVEEKENWPDGHVTWVSSTKVPIRDPAGRITGLVGVSRDITESKNLEARFLQAQKMEAFGQLAGSIAHDFNNILASMLMQLNLAQMEPGLSEPSNVWLTEIESSVRRAASLTRQMLLFSRRQSMETRVLDLNQEIAGVCEMLRRLVGDNIAFEWRRAPAPLWIESDPGMIEQILMNLCVNARDAMPQGGRLVVETSGVGRARHPEEGPAKTDRFVCLEVADNGSGMDEATRSRIFEPFFTTKPVGKGTGLGLATVYGIVKQHGGWIDVESAPNCGSTFRVYFPECEPPPHHAHPGGSKEIRGGDEKILLVEDEATLRSAMAGRLRRAGYDVVMAGNAAEALRIWDERSGSFDLLVTDVVMPGGTNGLQLAGQLAGLKPGLKVIAMTGHFEGPDPESLPSDIVRLAKPVAVDTLLENVRRLLDTA
jgi:PAS domain S-box-containing protein